MPDLQGLKNLRRILIASCECLDEACKCDDTERRGDLLSNISGQLHKDHIKSNCGEELAETADAEMEPIRQGIEKITTTVDDGSGPAMTRVRVRSVDPEEVDSTLSSMMEHTKGLLGNFSDKFGPIGSMIPDMEDEEVYDKAMGMSFDDMASKMQERLNSILGDEFMNGNSQDLDSPWFNNEKGRGLGMEEDKSEEVEEMSEPTLFPSKKLETPPEIQGGFEWSAEVDDTLLRFAADLCVLENMVKAASQNPNAISKGQLLAMIDPSKYEELDEELGDELIELFSGVIADELGVREASSSIQKMQKRAYQIIGEPEYLNTNDRRSRDGSMAPNYEDWLRNVGESHHRAMSRLEEIHHPDNEVMKLRIKDGERSNPIRRELAGTEVRMRGADLNDTENSPKDNMEKRLDDGPIGRRVPEGKDEDSFENKLDKTRGKSKVTGHPEQRLEKRRDDKQLETTESRMAEGDIHQDKKFGEVVDSLLNDWRSDHKEMLRQANAANKLIPTSLILGAPNMGGEAMLTDPVGAMEQILPEAMIPETQMGPGHQTLEGMLQGPKTDSLRQLLEEILGEVGDLKGKLSFQSNPEDVPMPSTALDAAVGSPDIHMGPGLNIPPNENGWNSFVDNSGEGAVSPQPPTK